MHNEQLRKECYEGIAPIKQSAPSKHVHSAHPIIAPQLATALAENLTVMVFRQALWFKHIRTQSSIC